MGDQFGPPKETVHIRDANVLDLFVEGDPTVLAEHRGAAETNGNSERTSARPALHASTP